MTKNQLTGNVYVLNDEQYNTIKDDYNPIGYNSGIYGWNYDIYLIGGEWCVYGYRPLLKWERITDTKLNKLIKGTDE